MQLFTSAQCSALFLLASTALISTVSAGDCRPLGSGDDKRYRFTAIAKLTSQPSISDNYLVFAGGNGESTFTVTVMKDGPSLRFGTMLDMKNVKSQSNAPIRQHQIKFQLHDRNDENGVMRKQPDQEYWLDTGDNCVSNGRAQVTMSAEDVKDVWVFVKEAGR